MIALLLSFSVVAPGLLRGDLPYCRNLGFARRAQKRSHILLSKYCPSDWWLRLSASIAPIYERDNEVLLKEAAWSRDGAFVPPNAVQGSGMLSVVSNPRTDTEDGQMRLTFLGSFIAVVDSMEMEFIPNVVLWMAGRC